MKADDWIILFGGAGRHKCVLNLLRLGYNIKFVGVPTDSSTKLKRSVEAIGICGVRIVELSRDALQRQLAPYAGASVISIGFPFLLPGELLSTFSKAINVHPSLLPSYRGPTSGAYVLINNEPVSGSTVHFLTSGMDDGNIICQSRVDISPFDTIRSLQRKIYSTEPELLAEALSYINKGYIGAPQPKLGVSEFPKKRKPSDSELDSSLPLSALVNFIRACDPDDFPAFFYHEGEKVCVKLWRPDKPDEEFDLI